MKRPDLFNMLLAIAISAAAVVTLVGAWVSTVLGADAESAIAAAHAPWFGANHGSQIRHVAAP